MESRLAAILGADVVGYSRLMEADEEATLHMLNACRDVIDGLVARHCGRVFGSAADSVSRVREPCRGRALHCRGAAGLGKPDRNRAHSP